MADHQTAVSSTTLAKRLIAGHVRPHWRSLALAALLMAVVAVATAASAWLFQPAIDEVFIARDQSMLYLVPLAIALVAGAKGLAAFGQNVLMNQVGQRIVADTQVAMFDHIVRADLAWLQDHHTGKLVASFLYDVTLLREAVSRAVTGIAKDALSVVLLVGVMFYQHLGLALVTLFVFPLAALAMRHIGGRMRDASRAAQEETGVLSAQLTEAFSGSRLIKAFGMEAREGKRARAQVEKRLGHLMRAVRTKAAASPVSEALGGIAVAAAILYGGLEARAGEITLGALTSFLGAMLLAYQPLKSVANLNASLHEGLAAAERIFALLDTAPEICDRPGALPLEISQGAISFEHVGFAYPNGTEAVTNLTFEAVPGGCIAIVGPSGAGKSTVLNLIPRFFEPTSGRILIDGQDITHVTLASLREHIALVTQETMLFDMTVRENIAFGNALASEAEIEAAARAAAAHDFISALPQGYDTRVGEAGVKLSGGERQRIAIARATLKDAPLLLLDEATSALDATSESQVREALDILMAGRTTIVVAHRLSTVAGADRIFVMTGGRIVESGGHRDLLARDGAYAGLYGEAANA